MTQIVRVNSPVLAVVANRERYVEARYQAEELSCEHGLTVADMPMVIQAMTSHPEVREAIRPDGIDTITGEYHGQRDGNLSYEVWHSAGSLATAKGLEKLFSKAAGEYNFMPISRNEWVAVGAGSSNGQTVARVHLEDARKGDVPAPGTPYTIFVRLGKDSHTIIHYRGQLDYDTFMQDDRVLMITGGPESREALAQMLFDKKEGSGEGWSDIGSYHRINEVGFGKHAKGRLVYLNCDDYGFNGDGFHRSGRFVGVGAGGVQSAEGERAAQNSGPYREPSYLARQTLEDVLAFSKDFVPDKLWHDFEAGLYKLRP